MIRDKYYNIMTDDQVVAELIKEAERRRELRMQGELMHAFICNKGLEKEYDRFCACMDSLVTTAHAYGPEGSEEDDYCTDDVVEDDAMSDDRSDDIWSQLAEDAKLDEDEQTEEPYYEGSLSPKKVETKTLYADVANYLETQFPGAVIHKSSKSLTKPQLQKENRAFEASCARREQLTTEVKAPNITYSESMKQYIQSSTWPTEEQRTSDNAHARTWGTAK